MTSDMNDSGAMLPPLPEPTEGDDLPPPGSVEVDEGAPLEFDEPGRRKAQPPGIRRTMAEATQGRIDSERIENDARALQSFVSKMRGKMPRAYLDVSRDGPIGLPQQEIGRLGRIPISQLRGKLPAEVIEATWGGGEYVVRVRDERNEEIEGGTFDVVVAGTIRPRSVEGRAYVRTLGENSEVNDTTSRVIDRLERVAQDVTAGSTNAQGRDVGMAMFQIMFEQMRSAEADRRSAEEERRREEREERRQRDEELRLEREERAKRVDAQIRAEAEERKRAHEIQMKHLETMATAQLEAMKRAGAAEGGLGTGVLKRVLKEVEEVVGDRVAERFGGPRGAVDDTPESWGDVARKIAADHGGDLLRDFLGVIGEKVAPGRVPPRRPAPSALPAPGAPTDEVPEVDADVGDAPGDAPGGPVALAPTPQAALTSMAASAAAKTTQRVVAFLRYIGAEIMAQGDPIEAWDTEQEDGTTLASAYLRLPVQLRAAWRGGWPAFARAIPAGGQPDVQAVARLFGHPAARAWFGKFHAEGPYEEDTAAVLPEDGADPAAEEPAPQAEEPPAPPAPQAEAPPAPQAEPPPAPQAETPPKRRHRRAARPPERDGPILGSDENGSDENTPGSI